MMKKEFLYFFWKKYSLRVVASLSKCKIIHAPIFADNCVNQMLFYAEQKYLSQTP